MLNLLIDKTIRIFRVILTEEDNSDTSSESQKSNDFVERLKYITVYNICNIPFNIMVTEKEAVESFYVELNLCNKKDLINSSYNPEKTMISYHLKH